METKSAGSYKGPVWSFKVNVSFEPGAQKKAHIKSRQTGVERNPRWG